MSTGQTSAPPRPTAGRPATPRGVTDRNLAVDACEEPFLMSERQLQHRRHDPVRLERPSDGLQDVTYTPPRPVKPTRTGRALLVSSTGGHLDELMHLNARFAPGFSDVRFVTFDHPQPRSLLPPEQVAYIPPVYPRDLAGSLRTMSTAADLLDRYDPTAVISTGAAVAVPFMIQARRRGIAAHYIESAARSEGPSLTGRLVSRIPGVSLYTQHDPWSSGKWGYGGSVFDGYDVVARADTPASPRLVVVTLGTLDQFPFRRAVEAILPVVRQVADEHTRVLWQVGNIPVADLGISGIQSIPADQLQSVLYDADLVFAHAGVGSCLRILEAGRVPVLVPRDRRHREHVDDHQRLVAASLSRRGLAIHGDPGSLTVSMARLAMRRQVRRRSIPPPFRLA